MRTDKLNALATFLFLILSFTLPLIQAGVYKWTDVEGRVQFSDHPVANAQQLRLPSAPPLVTIPATNSGTLGSVYTLFEIAEPEHNQTVRNEQGQVLVSLLLEPLLQPTHEFSFILDGMPVTGHFVTPQLLLSQVARGSHRLQVNIVDAQGQVLASTPAVTFHLRRAAETLNSIPPAP